MRRNHNGALGLWILVLGESKIVRQQLSNDHCCVTYPLQKAMREERDTGNLRSSFAASSLKVFNRMYWAAKRAFPKSLGGKGRGAIGVLGIRRRAAIAKLSKQARTIDRSEIMA